jgi:hypothetical protein
MRVSLCIPRGFLSTLHSAVSLRVRPRQVSESSESGTFDGVTNFFEGALEALAMRARFMVWFGFVGVPLFEIAQSSISWLKDPRKLSNFHLYRVMVVLVIAACICRVFWRRRNESPRWQEALLELICTGIIGIVFVSEARSDATWLTFDSAMPLWSLPVFLSFLVLGFARYLRAQRFHQSFVGSSSVVLALAFFHWALATGVARSTPLRRESAVQFRIVEVSAFAFLAAAYCGHLIKSVHHREVQLAVELATRTRLVAEQRVRKLLLVTSSSDRPIDGYQYDLGIELRRLRALRGSHGTSVFYSGGLRLSDGILVGGKVRDELRELFETHLRNEPEALDITVLGNGSTGSFSIVVSGVSRTVVLSNLSIRSDHESKTTTLRIDVDKAQIVLHRPNLPGSSELHIDQDPEFGTMSRFVLTFGMLFLADAVFAPMRSRAFGHAELAASLAIVCFSMVVFRRVRKGRIADVTHKVFRDYFEGRFSVRAVVSIRFLRLWLFAAGSIVILYAYLKKGDYFDRIGIGSKPSQAYSRQYAVAAALFALRRRLLFAVFEITLLSVSFFGLARVVNRWSFSNWQTTELNILFRWPFWAFFISVFGAAARRVLRECNDIYRYFGNRFGEDEFRKVFVSIVGSATGLQGAAWPTACMSLLESRFGAPLAVRVSAHGTLATFNLLDPVAKRNLTYLANALGAVASADGNSLNLWIRDVRV